MLLNDQNVISLQKMSIDFLPALFLRNKKLGSVIHHKLVESDSFRIWDDLQHVLLTV